MSAILFHSPEVQAAVIDLAWAAVTGLVAAIYKSIVAHHKARYARLAQEYALLEKAHAVATSDILFLLAVEEKHCQHRKDHEGNSAKLVVRHAVTSEGHEWSGRYTPGRIARREANAGLPHPWLVPDTPAPLVVRLCMWVMSKFPAKQAGAQPPSVSVSHGEETA